jgi:hypothetical protein
VKSTVNAAAVRDFVVSSKEISDLNFTVQDGFDQNRNTTGAINTFVAFCTDLKNNDPDSELRRFVKAMVDRNMDPLSGIVSVICIPGRGLWNLIKDNNKNVWGRLNSTEPRDHLVGYVGLTSSTCFYLHAERIGANPQQSLELSIGPFLKDLDFIPINDL